MSRLLLICVVGLLVGCRSPANQDIAPICEAVLKHEFSKDTTDEKIYLLIDGKDPDPELLNKLRQQLPRLEAGSRAARGKVTRIDLTYIRAGRNGAELRCTVSNGIDGWSGRLWLTKNGGTWVVERTQVEEMS